MEIRLDHGRAQDTMAIQTTAAWGLEFGASAVRLARVVRTSGGLKLDQCRVHERSDRWNGESDLAGAVEALRRQGGEPSPADERLVVCIADQVTLFGTLNLPQADHATTQNMVEAQFEVMLAGGAQDFSWDWHSEGAAVTNGQPRCVRLFAARKDAVAAALAAAEPLGLKIAGVVPSALAVSAAYSQLFNVTDPHVLLLDVAARSASLTIVRHGRAAGCVAVDEAADHWIEQIAEQLGATCQNVSAGMLSSTPDQAHLAALAPLLNEWSHRVREAYEASVEHIRRGERPTRCLLIGRGRHIPGLTDALGAALGLQITDQPPLKDNWPDSDAILGATGAIGSAMVALDAQAPAINLAPTRGPKAAAAGWVTRRRVGLVAWLVAAVLALYLADVWQVRRLEHLSGRIENQTELSGGLDRILAIANHLRKIGPPPLAVLDELSTITPKPIVLSAWHYGRIGDVRIKGTATNAGELNNYLKALADCKSLATVNIMNQEAAKNKKVKFDIAATVSLWIGPTKPTAKKDEQPAPKQEDTEKKDSPKAPKPQEKVKDEQPQQKPESTEKKDSSEDPKPPEKVKDEPPDRAPSLEEAASEKLEKKK